MRRYGLALILILAGSLAACDSPPPPPSFPDLRFTAQQPFRLGVAAIDIVDQDPATFKAPRVEHLFPVSPGHAVENWARDRLVAAGGPERLRFTILRARVIEVELPKKTGGIEGAVTTEASQRYDASVQLRLDILDDHGLATASVSVAATRSQTVLADITPNQRDQTWYDMTKALMADVDQQLSAQIRTNFFRDLQL